MKRTGPAVLIVAAVLGAGAGFALDRLLSVWGRPTFTPTSALPVLLVVVGAVIVALAVPIHRATHGRSRARIDPFRALRVAMLAKASGLVGALFAGVGVGLLVFVLTRPADPSVGSVAAVVAATVGALLLMVAGLIAEHLCTIGKDDDDTDPGRDEPDSAGPDRPRVEGPGGTNHGH